MASEAEKTAALEALINGVDMLTDDPGKFLDKIDAIIGAPDDAPAFDERTQRLIDRGTWDPTCSYCRQHAPGSMMPSHTASSRCQSGGRNHCTCDTCF